MNFLEIAQRVRVLSGVQGTGPSTVVGAGGYEATLVAFVRDAWIDIQNLRDEWDFLKTSDHFFTVASQDTYTLAEMLTTQNHKKWDKNSIVITDTNKKYLRYRPQDILEEIYLNSTDEGVPTEFTINTSDSLTFKNIPTAIYRIDVKYWREPQVLALDADIPLCKPAFHQLIVYKALEKMAIYLSSPELFRGYSTEAMRMTGQLMRSELKSKTVAVRHRGLA